MEIFALGLSHRQADVAGRERVSLAGDRQRAFLQGAHRRSAIEEALVLDTCNRTEIYYVARDGQAAEAEVFALIEQVTGQAPPAGAFARYAGPEAVEHLFRVSASLESQLLGEHQVLSQVKAAYREALEERTARFFLNKLMHRAFRVGKRVRTETQLNEGALTLPAAAAALAERTLGSLAGASAVLLGAGETAELAARALLDRGAASLTVANRTVARAREVLDALLAGPPGQAPVHCPARCRASGRRDGGPDAPAIETRAIGLAELAEAVAVADVVIASTAAEQPVLTADALAGRLAGRSRPLVIVDLAVPRDVEPAVGELPGVQLGDLDALTDAASSAAAARAGEVPAAEAIVAEECDAFDRWYQSLGVAPTIRLLKRHLANLAAEAVGRYGSQFGDQAESLQAFTDTLCNRILHDPIRHLRELAERGTASDRLGAVQTVRAMFDLAALADADDPADPSAEEDPAP